MHIDQYHFGNITIEGTRYTSDVIISPEGVNDSWWRIEGHEVCQEDLEPIFQKNPDILIIGTGAYGRMKVLPDARDIIDQRCEEAEILGTEDAVKRYNEEQNSTDRCVVAALHLTC